MQTARVKSAEYPLVYALCGFFRGGLYFSSFGSGSDAKARPDWKIQPKSIWSCSGSPVRFRICTAEILRHMIYGEPPLSMVTEAAKGQRQPAEHEPQSARPDKAVMYAFSVIPRSELTYPQDLDALVRFGIGYYPDYYNNRGIRHKLNGLIPAQRRSQAILAAPYSICTRFSKSSVRLFWCPFGSRGRVKALALLQKQSL